MQVQIEEYSAKNIFIFYVPQPLITNKRIVFAQSGKQGLLKNIFDIDGVQWCLVTPKLLAVKYVEKYSEDVKTLVLAEIADFMEENGQILEPVESVNKRELAEAVADVFIRPTLNRDKGDINLKFVADAQIEVEFTGHCAGCPYAQKTLQNVVIKTLQTYLPEIKKIYLKGAA